MMRKTVVLTCAILGVFVVTSRADFSLLDDFEGYALGEISSQSSNWTNNIADATVESASGNQYLVQGTTDNAHTIYNDGTTLLEDNATGTFFFRAFMPAGGSHNGIGVSAKEGYQNGWSDAGAILRFGGSDPATKMYGYDEAAGAAGTYSLLSTNTTSELWYNFWVVLNNSGTEGERSYDVYVQRDGDMAFETQTLIGDDLFYRVDANTVVGSIESLYFRSANDGVALYVDDLYFDGSGENLTSPLMSEPPLGDLAMITNVEFSVSGDLLIYFTPGGSGYELTSTPTLEDNFFVGETNAVYDGVNMFTVPVADLSGNQGYYRVEVIP